MTDDESDCEFCNGRACARKGGSRDENPYVQPEAGYEFYLWELGFATGKHERELFE